MSQDELENILNPAPVAAVRVRRFDDKQRRDDGERRRGLVLGVFQNFDRMVPDDCRRPLLRRRVAPLAPCIPRGPERCKRIFGQGVSVVGLCAAADSGFNSVDSTSRRSVFHYHSATTVGRGSMPDLCGGG